MEAWNRVNSITRKRISSKIHALQILHSSCKEANGNEMAAGTALCPRLRDRTEWVGTKVANAITGRKGKYTLRCLQSVLQILQLPFSAQAQCYALGKYIDISCKQRLRKYTFAMNCPGPDSCNC